jgi:hypothetical protein
VNELWYPCSETWLTCSSANALQSEPRSTSGSSRLHTPEFRCVQVNPKPTVPLITPLKSILDVAYLLHLTTLGGASGSEGGRTSANLVATKVQLGAVSDFLRLAGTMSVITRTDTKPRGGLTATRIRNDLMLLTSTASISPPLYLFRQTVFCVQYEFCQLYQLTARAARSNMG